MRFNTETNMADANFITPRGIISIILNRNISDDVLIRRIQLKLLNHLIKVERPPPKL